MQAIQLNQFGDYDQLTLVDLPKPEASMGKVLVKMIAAAINPLDNTVRLGHFPYAKQLPLILGNEGMGTIVDAGDSNFTIGTRVMISGGFGVFQDGTWQEYIAADPQALVAIPDNVSDEAAAGTPVAYLTAQLALNKAGFTAGQIVVAPAIGGSIGNAVVQLAVAQGASQVITTAGSTAKATRAKLLGYTDVIDLSQESLRTGVGRLTSGGGGNIAIDSVGGTITGELLASLKQGGTLVTLGYTAGLEVNINLMDLLSKVLHLKGFNLFLESPEAVGTAFTTIVNLLREGKIKPVVDRVFPLSEAANAQRYMIENRPFGKVLLKFN